MIFRALAIYLEVLTLKGALLYFRTPLGLGLELW